MAVAVEGADGQDVGVVQVAAQHLGAHVGEGPRSPGRLWNPASEGRGRPTGWPSNSPGRSPQKVRVRGVSEYVEDYSLTILEQLR